MHGQQNIETNKPFHNMVKLKYLGTTLTNHKCLHEGIVSKLNSGNACYQSVPFVLHFVN